MAELRLSPNQVTAVAAQIPAAVASAIFYSPDPDDPAMGTLTVPDEYEAVVLAADPDASPQPPRRFTFLEFMDLLTPAEQVAIVESSNINVKIFLLMATGAQYINLDDSRTVAAIEALVPLGLITEERAAAVLTGVAPE